MRLRASRRSAPIPRYWRATVRIWRQPYAAIADAFSGARVGVSGTDGYFELEMRQNGLLRPLKTSELSDGTLRYLLLVAALLSPRPPALMILNEPETSLHPELLPALARLIAKASRRSQVVVVSHAPALVAALDAVPDSRRIVLEKLLGETVVKENTPPDWAWRASRAVVARLARQPACLRQARLRSDGHQRRIKTWRLAECS